MIELTKEHYEYMNIGRRFWDAEMHQVSLEKRNVLRGYLKAFRLMIDKGVGVYLWGSNGVGKTHLAASMLKLAWGRWKVSGYFITASDLKQSWIEDFPANLGSEELVSYRTTKVPLLVIDDIGREHRASSGYAENRLGALIRSRSSNLKTTIMTSNLNPQEFKRIYGNSIADLVSECLLPMEIKGESFRKKEATQVREEILSR